MKDKTPQMNRPLLLILMLLVCQIGQAQKVSRIDFDEIKEAISDSTSHYFYENLLERFHAFDTTLNREDYKYLYYGNVFQSYYHPYGATEKEKKFNEDFDHEAVSFSELEDEGMEVLKENPVNLQIILKMIFLYNKEKKLDQARTFAKIYVSFLEVIYASGTGKDCENGFVVISVDDEYRITGDLGLTVVKQALVGACDRLAFSKKGQKRKNRIKELYFNVRMPLTYLSKAFDQSDLPEPDDDPDEEEE